MTGATFLNGVMLAGLGGAAVPLVLHLLSRARYRSVEWGAMMFLHDADVRGEPGARAKQWVLLGLRMATVALLAVALARPVIAGRWGGHAGAGAVDVVIVLDRSASMARPEGNGRTRFDLAKDTALQILSSLRKGDRVALLFAGDGTVAPPGVAMNDDLQAAAARVADLRVSAGFTDFAAELPAAVAAFDGRSRAARQLYIVTDDQAVAWERVNELFTITWRQRLAQLGGEPPQVHVIPVGTPSRENVAVESFRLVDPPVVVGTPVSVEVTLRNYGPAPRELPLVVRSPDGTLFANNVAVPPGASTDVRFTCAPKTAGAQLMTAEIRGDALADDRRQLAVDVAPPIGVLVVSGDEPSEPARQESYYLRAALAPFRAVGRGNADLAAVQVQSWEQWQGVIAPEHRVLVLANVPELTPQQARAAEQFVYAGGGLLIAPGSLTRPDRYNALLRRDLNALLPAELGPSETRLLTIGEIDHEHAVFQPAAGGSKPPMAEVTRHVHAEPDEDAYVVARLSDGNPLVVESTYGGGRVILITTALDADWSTLPLTPHYLPLVQSIVKRLASASLDDRNLDAGDDLRATFDGAVDGGKVELTLPNGTRRPLAAVQFGGRTEARFESTDLPGLYTLRASIGGKERALQYVVRSARAESNPVALAPARWSELEALLDVSRIDAPREALASALTEIRTGRELWAALLSGVIVLGLIEMMLARRWSAGAN